MAEGNATKTVTVTVPIYTRMNGNEIELGTCEIEIPVRLVIDDDDEHEPPVCPECVQHKCGNCAGVALDADDLFVDCACKVAGHA
jgi:hypothetical protein